MKMNEAGAAWLRENGACTEGFRWARLHLQCEKSLDHSGLF
jgi:hypothetical protein